LADIVIPRSGATKGRKRQRKKKEKEMPAVLPMVVHGTGGKN